MHNVAYIFGGQPRVIVSPELSDISAFKTYLGITQGELKKIWWYRHRMYSTFNISKKAGKARIINAPNRRLKMLQRRIAAMLDSIYRPRRCVHGFTTDRSVKTNAESHLRSKHIVNIDLKDFFPSITEKRVIGLLSSIGVDQAVAHAIARICCVNGYLPQGAPSSPVISNMICLKIDIALFEFSKSVRCIYTRYADDITFSSFQPPTGVFNGSLPASGNFEITILSNRLQEIITGNGFSVNPQKAHYSNKISRQMVTGVKVNSGLNVDRRYIRNISAALHQVRTKGIEEAQAGLLSKMGKSCPISYHLHGRINWVGQIKGRADPVYRRLAERYNGLFDFPVIKTQPSEKETRSRSVWVINDGIDEDEGVGIQGTAFFLRDVGLVTAHHCVPEDRTYTVFHPSQPYNKFEVNVLKSCKYRDLAILTHNIPSSEFFEFQLSNIPAIEQQEVVAAGFPTFGPGDSLNIRPGTVSSLSVKHGVSLIEVTQKLTQGMSGGPVLNVAGEVVGVIHKGGPNEGRDFAIAASVLSGLLAE